MQSAYSPRARHTRERHLQDAHEHLEVAAVARHDEQRGHERQVRAGGEDERQRLRLDDRRVHGEDGHVQQQQRADEHAQAQWRHPRRRLHRPLHP
jgi:hypothetical protein